MVLMSNGRLFQGVGPATLNARYTPRLRTDSTGCSVSVPTTMVLLDCDRLRSDEDEPNRMSSVFAAFSCSRRDPHQSATSAIQCCMRSDMDCICDGVRLVCHQRSSGVAEHSEQRYHRHLQCMR